MSSLQKVLLIVFLSAGPVVPAQFLRH